MKVELRFEIEVVNTSDAEVAYAVAEGALMETFGSESVRGDEPRIDVEGDE